ncbi:MAG: polymer-forming cytoskeletal protein [Gemmatimonadota bacterium]
MAKDGRSEFAGRDPSDVVSVIGPGMEIVGDVKSDGTIRVEGHVEGSVKAAKSVVIGRDGVVDGDIETQDVVVAGRVAGTISADSRVELQESCRVEGDIRSRRIKLDEGGRVEGRLHMGSEAFPAAAKKPVAVVEKPAPAPVGPRVERKP